MITRRQRYTPASIHHREATDPETPQSRTIEGYAIIFNQPSELLDTDQNGRKIIETIAPEAITRELLDGSDIKFTMFHDRQLILARSIHGRGTLSYSIDDHGVAFSFEAPQTADGDKALELIRRGDLCGCSFAFSTDYTDPECVSCTTDKQQTTYTVKRIFRVFDFTLAADPAYPQTEAHTRQTTPTTTHQTHNKPMTTYNDHDRQLRETLASNRHATIALRREVLTTDNLDDTGIITIEEQEMLKPLRAGLIWDKVGISIRAGLPAGRLRWPRHSKAVAQFADEGARIEAANIQFDRLDCKPQRLSIAIPISREELDYSQGIIENVVTEEMPAAIIDLVNSALFTTEANTTDGKRKKVVGPFVAAKTNALQFAASIPTRKELLQLKSRVVGSGIKLTAPCWVMTEATKAQLEDIKVDAGSGRFICENDTILGYPVFTTPEIGEGNIGFGDWSYQAAGFFGDMNLIVDPYTLARNNATDFVLNGHFATVTLCDEAFALGTPKA